MAIKIIDKHRAKLIVSLGSRGTRKRYAKTVTYTGKRDLEKQYQAFEDECLNRIRTDLTVEGLLEAYIANAEMRGLSANTLHGYRSAKARITDALGSISADALTAYQVDDFVAALSRKYKPKTVHSTISLLSSAYQRAIRLGQLKDDPCRMVTLPKQQRPEIQTLSEDQIRAFLQKLEAEPIDLRVGYKLCLLCGLRRGEVLGLREEDVDTRFGWVSVSRTRYKVEGQERIQEPKTARSRRTLALPEILKTEIAELIEEHHSHDWNECDYLIQNGFGEPVSPSVFSGRISKLCDGVTVHGLRHTFATLLNAHGMDMAQISAELGHSNLSTTANIYTHIFGGFSASSRTIAETVNGIAEKWGSDGAPTEKKKASKR